MKNFIEGELSYRISGICFAIHNQFGRFLTERQYSDALAAKFIEEGASFVREPDLKESFKSLEIKVGRPDFVIGDKIILDVKAKKFITKEDYNQMMKYLTLTRKALGLIVNFRSSFLKPKRILNPNFDSEHSDEDLGHSGRHSGFTLIELLVVTAITVVLGGMVALNFRRLRTTQELQTVARDVTSKIREIQNFVFAGKVPAGGTAPADSYDLTFTVGGQTYRVDYITRTSPNTTTTTTLETVNLPSTSALSQILVNGASRSTARVRVESPFAKILVDGVSYQTTQLQLLHLRTSQTRSIIIDGISGRIEVR